MRFKTLMNAALVAALVSAAPLATMPAHAAVAVTFDSGNVAFGYSDGYWDRTHAWHPWPNAAARNNWRKQNAAHYYGHRHSRDKNAGWRSQWW